MKSKILIAEDDKAILIGLTELLSGEGFKTVTADNGEEALRVYKDENPDLVILDVMMPEKSGYDVCKEIRKNDAITPIIMLTAKGQEIDKVVGLENGADDYVVKPFGIHELLARVRAALRRKNAKPFVKDSTPIIFDGISIYPDKLKGEKDGREFNVTLREVELLKLFIQNEGKVLDRNTLLDKVWGVKYEGTTRTLDQHIAKLRQKLENDPANPEYILTVFSAGYKFTSGKSK